MVWECKYFAKGDRLLFFSILFSPPPNPLPPPLFVKVTSLKEKHDKLYKIRDDRQLRSQKGRNFPMTCG